jgi:hypothetical protein
MADHSISVTVALDRIRNVLENKSADTNKAVIEALNKLRNDLEQQSADESKAVIEALNKARDVILAACGAGNIDYPQIANGPVEHVLGFNNNEFIALKDVKTKHPYFSSHGVLTDLHHNELPGSKVETTFPVDPARIGGAFQWPPKQPAPFDRPPLDDTNTTGHGPSKQAYFFGDGSSLVTVGPSLPKIALLKGGGAQFWVGSIGVITQGTGKYAGARGMSVYLGSAYLENWPNKFEEQAEVLAAGFTALVSTYFKLVLKKDVG